MTALIEDKFNMPVDVDAEQQQAAEQEAVAAVRVEDDQKNATIEQLSRKG